MGLGDVETEQKKRWRLPRPRLGLRKRAHDMRENMRARKARKKIDSNLERIITEGFSSEEDRQYWMRKVRQTGGSEEEVDDLLRLFSDEIPVRPSRPKRDARKADAALRKQVAALQDAKVGKQIAERIMLERYEARPSRRPVPYQNSGVSADIASRIQKERDDIYNQRQVGEGREEEDEADRVAAERNAKREWVIDQDRGDLKRSRSWGWFPGPDRETDEASTAF